MNTRKEQQMSRRKAKYEIQRDMNDNWETLDTGEGVQIHSVQDAARYLKENKCEGTFRVIAIKAHITLTEVTKTVTKIT